MDVTFQHFGMVMLLLLTGLSAGLCFTWSNAITPGIGRLDNLNYLLSFQQMNRSILNPLFFIVFFGPTLLGFINGYVLRNAPRNVLWIVLIAIALYFLGVVLVTFFGNVPLNNLLESADLHSANSKELETLRGQFEVQWNRLHCIRTISAIVSFILLTIGLIQLTKAYA